MKDVIFQRWLRQGNVVACWLIAVVCIWWLAFLIGVSMRANRKGEHFPRSPARVLSTFDGEHYGHIAAVGYSTEGAERRQFAFFPLLPAISRLLGGASGAPLAGILVSQICLLGSMVLLSVLAHGDRGGPLIVQP